MTTDVFFHLFTGGFQLAGPEQFDQSLMAVDGVSRFGPFDAFAKA